MASTYSGVQVKSWCNVKNRAQAVAADPDGNLLVAVVGQEFAVHTLLPVNEEEAAASPAELDSDDEPITDEATILVADSVFTLDLGQQPAAVLAACFHEDTLVIVVKYGGAVPKYVIRRLGTSLPDGEFELGIN